MKYILLILLFCLQPARAEIRPYFSPSPDCEREIIQEIKNSKAEIKIAIYALTNKNIIKALEQAHQKGVVLQIIVDKTQSHNPNSGYEILKKQGINIQRHNKYKIEHNKFAVFDKQKLVTGSYNWTAGATKHNSENCIFISNQPQTIKKYLQRFEFLWNKH